MPQQVPSPCVNVCALDPQTGWCRGCLRTLDEIAQLIEMTAEDKLATLERVAARRDAFSQSPGQTDRT
jgi:predicted Fe-S protein YdhL (DUF1289 family)